jgi:hypothetical protein
MPLYGLRFNFPVYVDCLFTFLLYRTPYIFITVNVFFTVLIDMRTGAQKVNVYFPM